MEYEDEEPVRVDTVIVSCQHAEEKSLKVAYGIGMAEPVMVQVDTYGTGNVCEDESMVNTGTFWEQRENGKLDLSLFQAITEEAPAE